MFYKDGFSFSDLGWCFLAWDFCLHATVPILQQSKSETDDAFHGFKEQWVLVFRRRGNVSQGWVFIFWHGMVSSGVSFPFSHHRTPVTAICFGAEAFSHMGFGRKKKKKRSKVMVVFINWKFEIIKVKCSGMLVGLRWWGGLPHVKVVQKVVGEGVASVKYENGVSVTLSGPS